MFAGSYVILLPWSDLMDNLIRETTAINAVMGSVITPALSYHVPYPPVPPGSPTISYSIIV